ncbi:aromatic amino acid lyase [bacterium]|nr:aromatic amino acid lyase [bacterium]
MKLAKDFHIDLRTLFKYSLGSGGLDISEDALAAVRACRDYINELIAKNTTMYGVNTGFGELAKVRISSEELDKLQENIILSHSIGVGKIACPIFIKGAMLLKLRTFLQGHSGVTEALVKNIALLLNKGLIPVATETGSLGASGDLIPLSQMFAVFYEKGEFYYKGKIISAQEGLRIAGIEDFSLHAKEGLALTNGMQFSASLGGISLFRLYAAMELFLKLAALQFEIMDVNPLPFEPEVHDLRPFPGQKTAASLLYKYLKGREINKDNMKVQDPYTVRCIPQITGGILDNLAYVRGELEVEFNSVSDNPLFIPEKDLYLSGGNFHGQAIGLALDSGAISVSVFTSLLERMANRLINPNLSSFPAFLVEASGLNSGFMMVQYAMAALANKCATLASPSSIFSIPVSGDQEDFVSMAGNAAVKFKDGVEIAVEGLSLYAMSVFQAAHFYKGTLSDNARSLKEEFSSVWSFYEKDRFLRADHEKILEKIWEVIDNSDAELV